MKRAALALALLTATPALAQKLPVRLAEGAAWTFVATHERESEGGKSYSVTTSKRLTWTAGPSGQGRLRMDHLSVTANAGLPPEAAFTQTLTIPVEFEVDEGLAPNGVRNPDQVRAAVREMLVKSGATPQEIDRRVAANPAILDQTAMALVGRELGLLARAQGSNLRLGLPGYEEDETPNPLGGPMIRSRLIYELESYDAATGRAVVTWRSAMDPDSMRASLVEAAERAPPARRAEAQAAFAKMRVENERSCRNEIDIPSGLAVKIECLTRLSVTSDDKTRTSTDRWTITQTLPGSTR